MELKGTKGQSGLWLRSMAGRLVIATGTLLAMAFVMSSSPTHAQIPYDHLFDPERSLEGDCKAEDGVADPSCPYQGLPPLGPQAFNRPCGVTVDGHGSIYVAQPSEGSVNGRIDVFDAEGKFLVEIPDQKEPCQIAVDSVGNLYVAHLKITGSETIADPSMTSLARYEPDEYPPGPGVEYSLAAEFEFEGADGSCAEIKAVAIDPSNDHLYIGKKCAMEEYGSAIEGTPLNPLVKCCIGEAVLAGKATKRPRGLDIYGGNHDVYLAFSVDGTFPTFEPTSLVYVIDGSTGEIKCLLEGTELTTDPVTGESMFPKFEFELSGPGAAIALDQTDRELYVYDIGHEVIDQFALDGKGGEECPQYSYTRKLPPPTTDPNPELDPPFVNLAVDAPCLTGAELSESCDSAPYVSPNEGEVYVTVGQEHTDSHLYAFKPRKGGPPEVLGQTTSGLTETEAVLEAEVNPSALETSYHFEYTTQTDFEENDYANAISVPEPPASAGNEGAFVAVAVPVAGLEPGTAYRFRLVASNCADLEADPSLCLTEGEGLPGGEGADASFATYPEPVNVTPCTNEALRVGPSEALPDCRAYELVTPPDTGGHIPTMSMLGADGGRSGFATAMASPDGESVVFGSRSGPLPDLGGGGFADAYEAVRNPSVGWQSEFFGLSGEQVEEPRIGGISPDHKYGFRYVAKGDRGTLIEGGEEARYLRVPAGTQSSPNCTVPKEPEGRLELIGCGALGADPSALGKWISTGGGHVVFEASVQLEGNCGASGTTALYDRTPGGENHCVSLLPGEIPPAGGVNYRGTSADGSAVAFAVGSTLYVRLGNTETVEVAEGNPTFGGMAQDGSRVFYLKGGDVFAFDTEKESEPTSAVGSGGKSTLVYVSSDGSHAFFVSSELLDGAEGEAEKDNLYVWDGSEVHFIAVLDPLDVSGVGAFGQGLGRWIGSALNPIPGPGTGPADVPARATPDGSVFLFESQADLAGHEGNGHRQVYRYEEEAPAGKRLRCISCNPTGAPAAAAGQLESLPSISAFEPFPPVNSLTQIANVTADGEKAFFQSGEPLVSTDVDGKQDIYEWQAQGSGGCGREGGCLALISYPRSADDEYLYGMTPDGSGIFLMSGETLVPQDPDGTPSIYDARELGGFPPPSSPKDPCLGEACQPAAAAPNDPTPSSASFEGPGSSPTTGKQCPKGKRKVRRAGKVRCVKRPAKKAQRRGKSAKHKRGARR
jgi:hypothetical protein